MTALRIGAVLLLIVGAGALIIPYIPITTEETVFEAGPIKAKAEEEHHFPVPAAVGAGLLLAGGALLLSQRRRG